MLTSTPKISSASSGGGGGSGTVTSVGVVTANGFSATIANATTDPSITLKTSVTGMLKGNGTAISAATEADYLPSQTGNAGKYLFTNGTTSSWEGVTQRVGITMVANTGGATVNDSGEYILDIDGLLTATGQFTITITNPTVPFTVFFDNRTTGGFNLNLTNVTMDIPSDVSIWYYDGTTFEQVFGVNQYVPVTRTVNGHVLSNNVVVTKSDVSLGNVDNTSDATKNAASVSLTNHTFDNSLNTLTIGADQSFGTHKITNLGDPISAQDGATKNYVDNNSTGIKNKTQNGITVGTTAALAANTYNNGTAGVGATITINAVGTLTVDTHQVLVNEYVLVKNEATTANNGYYKCTTEGTGGVAAVLTRDTGIDQTSEFTGAYIFVNTGSTNLNTGWNNTSTVTTVGTDAVTFVQFSASSGVVAGTGISVTGTTVAVNTSTVPLKTDNLSVFASTTSAQLAGVLSDETGTGVAVFNTSPLLITPSVQGLLTHTTNADQTKISLDTSLFREGTQSTLTSGAFYTLLGDQSMKNWTHNTALDSSGNFLGRDDTGTCSLWTFTEGDHEKHYTSASAAAGNVPSSWTLTRDFNTATGAVTYTGAITGSNLSGTNTGDQTSIVGITGTKAQFNTAVSDGDIVFLDSTDTITGTKTFNDGTLKLAGATSGASTLKAPAIASTYVHTLPAGTGTIAILELAQTWTKTQSPNTTTLTSSGASVAVDLSLGNYFTHTLTENTTLAAPSNVPAAGTTFTINFVQHASAAKTLAFNTAWKPITGTAGVLSTTLGAINTMTCTVRSDGVIGYGFGTYGIA